MCGRYVQWRYRQDVAVVCRGSCVCSYDFWFLCTDDDMVMMMVLLLLLLAMLVCTHRQRRGMTAMQVTG